MADGIREGLAPDRRSVMPDEKPREWVSEVREPFSDGAGDFAYVEGVFENRKGRSGFWISNPEPFQNLEGGQENLPAPRLRGPGRFDRVDMENRPGLRVKTVDHPVDRGFRRRPPVPGGGVWNTFVEWNLQNVLLGEKALVTSAGGDPEIVSDPEGEVSGRSLHPPPSVESPREQSEMSCRRALSQERDSF